MATRLHAPTLDGTLPAFNGTVSVTIPFTMNRAVGASSVTGFALKLKTVRSETYIGTLFSRPTSYVIGSNSNVTFYFNDEDNLLTRELESGEKESVLLTSLLNEGQFYKAQLAYIDEEGQVGYYSTLGIIKYTSAPKAIYIDGLDSANLNNAQRIFTGVYEFGTDASEKAASYRFIIRDNRDNIIVDTGELLHNTLTDEGTLSTDSYYYESHLEMDEIISVQYYVTTVNGLVVKTPRYRISGSLTVEPLIQTHLFANLNYENGYVEITMDGTHSTTGNFMIGRKDLTTDGPWNDIYSFAFMGNKPYEFQWGDFTVEQGHKYIYSVQQYNAKGIFSDRIVTDEIFADFEDAFLFDGERQLKIRFNPKVSSFKTDILETKTDTIGSKHPFIFRNGAVNYKEFPISGLLSYLSDNDELFLSNLEMDLTTGTAVHRTETHASNNLPYHVRTTQLEGYNVSAERAFKLSVLDWLNNGEVKLFRSPGEGNYIVRLLNNSLTPTDSVGRMLHTFNSTAYEVAEFNFAQLHDFKFVSNEMDTTTLSHTWGTVNIDDKLKTIKYGSTDVVNPLEEIMGTTTGFRVDDLLPETPITIIFESGETVIVRIGVTGSYTVSGLGNIKSVLIPAEYANYGGSMTIEYSSYDIAENATSFGLITQVESYTCPVQQFIGKYDYNILDTLHDTSTSVVKYIDLLFELLPVMDLYTATDIIIEDGVLNKKKTVFYLDPACTQEYEITLPLYMYKLHKATPSVASHLHAHAINTDSSNYTGEQYKTVYDADGHAALLNILENTAGYDKGSPFHKNEIYYMDAATGDYYEAQDGYLVMSNDDGLVHFVLEEDYNPCFYFNDSPIDLTEIESYELFNNIGEVDSIKLGNGVMFTCAYIARTISYSLEDNEPIRSAKAAYLLADKAYKDCFADPSLYRQLAIRRADRAKKYEQFQQLLALALIEYNKKMGVESHDS